MIIYIYIYAYKWDRKFVQCQISTWHDKSTMKI